MFDDQEDVAGDDDHKRENNPGRMKALEAAATVNGMAIFPELSAEQREQGMTDFNDLRRAQPEVVSRQLAVALNATREGRTIREAAKLRAADSTRRKEWLEMEKVRPIGFIGKDILAGSALTPELNTIHKACRKGDPGESRHSERERGRGPS